MKRLYQAKNEIEAQLIVDYLKDANIDAVLLNRYQSGAAGELSAIEFPWVWLLKSSDYYLAKTLIDSFYKEELSEKNKPDWTCNNCDTQIESQFHFCWNCGSEE
tara:strand:+ start:1797 stop:2108 length:312 start_codon:yes stop_codon:yes gene_type:complete